MIISSGRMMYLLKICFGIDTALDFVDQAGECVSCDLNFLGRQKLIGDGNFKLVQIQLEQLSFRGQPDIEEPIRHLVAGCCFDEWCTDIGIVSQGLAILILKLQYIEMFIKKINFADA